MMKFLAENAGYFHLIIALVSVGWLAWLVYAAPMIEGHDGAADGTVTPPEDVGTGDRRSAPLTRSCGTKWIEIVQCRDSNMWYKDHIGGRFEYMGSWPEGWVTREPSGYLNFVKREDCVIHLRG